jgi:hypothetical protein
MWVRVHSVLGFWHRHTSKIQELTNHGVIVIDEVNNPPTITRIPWSKVDSVVVMNQSSTGQGYHYTVRSGFYPSANYIGMNTWQAHGVGDVCFLSNGVIVAIFKQIIDPVGIMNLAKSVKRGSYDHSTNYMSDAPLRLT